MTRRTQRLGETFREVLSELIQRRLKDPRVGFVTITAVRVTPDLQKAHVYYTVLGDEDQRAETQDGLESATPFLRTEAGRRVRLKTLPELEFHYDEAVEHGQRIDELIGELHSSEHDPQAEEEGLPDLSREVDEALDAAADALGGDEPLHVACHVGPDGDALGSILAVALAMRDRGREVTGGWGSAEIVVPGQYAFLPGTELLRGPSGFGTPEVALAIDCASADRLEILRKRMEDARVLVNLDHHVSNTRFGTVDVVDETAASSAELVLRLLLRMRVRITSEIATCLYTGLVTDTGRFSYESVTPAQHEIAAYLISKGVDVAEVSRAIFETLPYGYLKVLGRVLDRCRMLSRPPLVVSHLTQKDLTDADISMDETEELINVLRAVKGADVAAIIKEQPDGRWKGSLRSKGDTDVGAIAQGFGGGGHRLAAGFTSAGELSGVIEELHAALAEAE